MMKRFFAIAIMTASVNSFAEVPTLALTFDTNVKISNATSTMTSKIRDAEALIKRVIASDAFRTKVLNFTYNGVKQFKDNGGYSNAQIYQKILDAAETLNGVKDNQMDLNIQMYYESSSTVGYTYSSSTTIYANTKFYNSYSAATITGNMMHEWLHKLGFKHTSYYTSSRNSSVPYAIGYIMRDLAADLPDEDAPALGAVGNLDLYTTRTQVHLTWEAAPGAVKYKVYRRLSGSSTAYVQSTTTNLKFYQTKPTKDAYYYVRSVDSAGKTVKSVEVFYNR